MQILSIKHNFIMLIKSVGVYCVTTEGLDVQRWICVGKLLNEDGYNL